MNHRRNKNISLDMGATPPLPTRHHNIKSPSPTFSQNTNHLLINTSKDGNNAARRRGRSAAKRVAEKKLAEDFLFESDREDYNWPPDYREQYHNFLNPFDRTWA